MSDPELLTRAYVDEPVRQRFPEYVAIVMFATGLQPGASSAHSESLLQAAESAALAKLGQIPPHELPEVAAWRDAFATFGVKPREARSSIEALLRRCGKDLPRIDRLTDVYNAISITHLVPIGGEDLSGYVGPARLVIADGSQTFDTVADGEVIEQFADVGEVVWRDDRGVTCRRWNWRQCVRTRLTETTTDAIFIFDGLGPRAQERVALAAEALIRELSVDSPNALFTQRSL